MFRPWGLLDWTLRLSQRRRWQFLGCLGTEERSITTFVSLAKQGLLSRKQTLLRIEEPDSPYMREAKRAIRRREREYRHVRLRPMVITLPLLTPLLTLESVCEGFAGSVILDITSLPKRYFFYFLKTFYNSESIENLIITYTLPERYPDAPLTENHDLWDALPSFRQPDPKKEELAHRRLIVNVGFIPNGILAHLEGRAEEKQIDLIVPFPAPIPAVQRTWRSLWALTSTPYEAHLNECRVEANDLSEAFELILSLAPRDTNLVSFAPFGPKPISAAMCLYASLTGSPVYYAQPKIYRPDYSLGVGRIDGVDAIYAYWIKHRNQKFFQLPSGRSYPTS